MTEAVFVLVETDTADDGTVYKFPLCAVLRTTEGEQALETALAMCDEAQIINGAYEGQPDCQYNGAGIFAIQFINAIAESWEKYTRLVNIGDLYMDGVLDMNFYDMTLEILLPQEGRVTHSHYDPV